MGTCGIWSRRRAARAVLALGLLAMAGLAQADEVALTYDDLTTLSLTNSTDYAEKTTDKLLKGLRHHHLTSFAFVNEGKLAGPDHERRVGLLRRWLAAGVGLGNHTYSHVPFTSTPVEAYIADTERGAPITRALLETRGEKLRWFRHPYLETGKTKEDRERFEHWLSEHGYRVAPVTMENSDWMFAIPYDNAVLHGDTTKARAIRRAYLDYTRFVVGWYQKAARAVFDRPIRYVFLLHACRLNANSMHDFAQILREANLQTITLDRAMEDPAYQTHDTYYGPDGNEWIERWSVTLHKELPWDDFHEPPKDIEAENNRLDRR